jgi:hypothetical protein
LVVTMENRRQPQFETSNLFEQELPRNPPAVSAGGRGISMVTLANGARRGLIAGLGLGALAGAVWAVGPVLNGPGPALLY